ncbi:MAG: hypothetical protein ACYSRP_02590 [Planctomycetota bacterium]|jgi:hypothetical protein
MTSALLEQEVCETTVLEERLHAFCSAVDTHDYLEIDGDLEGDSLSSHQIKVLNHNLKTAYSVSLESILKQEIDVVVEALETGVRDKLYGVTRIVGYYSRTSNWNKSKIGELRDRHSGDYSVRKVA